jgi:hypothetical protein
VHVEFARADGSFWATARAGNMLEVQPADGTLWEEGESAEAGRDGLERQEV